MGRGPGLNVWMGLQGLWILGRSGGPGDACLPAPTSFPLVIAERQFGTRKNRIIYYYDQFGTLMATRCW